MDISSHSGVRPEFHGPLVLIGHTGFATDTTACGSATSIGGSGFAAAFAAAALLDGVGLTIFNGGGYWVWPSGGWWAMPEV
jgi:hypothetical protein